MSISEEDSEDGLLNLYDLLYIAQINGKPVERLIGRDVEAFCQQYFEHQSLGRFVKGLPKELLRLVRYLAIVEIIFSMGDVLSGQIPKTVDLSIYLYSWLMGSLVGWGLGICYDQISRTRWFSTNRFYLLVFLALVPSIICSIWLSRLWPLQFSGQVVLMFSIIFVVGDTGYRSYQNYRRYGSLKNPDKQEVKTFKKVQNQQAGDQMVVDMLKNAGVKNWPNPHQLQLVRISFYESWLVTLVG